jgi:hypothetical protein
MLAIMTVSASNGRGGCVQFPSRWDANFQIYHEKRSFIATRLDIGSVDPDELSAIAQQARTLGVSAPRVQPARCG